jgi:drug/metabolite transporter (DMT)-like permease
LLSTTGRPRLREVPRIYLWGGMVLFVAFEVCFTLAIGLAADGRQAIEVSIVNYLWPSLTVLFALVFAGQRAGRLIVPGLLLSIAGVALVLGGRSGLDIGAIAGNIRSNPTSYVLALTGALVWAGYSTLTKLYSDGANGVGIFFIATAAVFWAFYVADGAVPMQVDGTSLAAIALAAGASGFGYYLWNYGISHGNMTMIAAMSYFTPVLSAAFSALVLAASLTPYFWAGTAIVSLGAMLCWIATRNKVTPRAAPEEALQAG